MAGDWQTTSERLVYENDFMKKEEAEDVKPRGFNVGVRKRKFEGEEEKEEAGETIVRKGWGSTIRAYPGLGDDDDDLNTLLKNMKRVIRDGEGLQPLQFDRSSQPKQEDGHVTTKESEPDLESPAIKEEESAGSDLVPCATLNETAAVETLREPIKQEEAPPDSGVIFKKRKAKPIRQK